MTTIKFEKISENDKIKLELKSEFSDSYSKLEECINIFESFMLLMGFSKDSVASYYEQAKEIED